MKPIPHYHGCPECSCSWPCMNANCTDLDGQWCKNFCFTCMVPPEYIARLQASEDAGHLLHQASFILRTQAQRPGLADQVDLLRESLLQAIQEAGKGIVLTRSNAQVANRPQEPES